MIYTPKTPFYDYGRITVVPSKHCACARQHLPVHCVEPHPPDKLVPALIDLTPLQTKSAGARNWKVARIRRAQSRAVARMGVAVESYVLSTVALTCRLPSLLESRKIGPRA